MDYQIVWTPEARSTFFDVINYLEVSFSEKEVSKFVLKTEEKVRNIQVNPKMYRRSIKIRNVHFTNIFGRTLLVYQVMPGKKLVVLIIFWDTRQNPNKFRY